MNTTNKARRFNRVCKGCGTAFSILASQEWVKGIGVVYIAVDGTVYQPGRMDSYKLAYTCSGCGAAKLAAAVVGKFNPGKKCSAKCLASTGFQCECACGGKNHGAGHETHGHQEAA